ncbi:O-antigen ligase family protein [Candidatus Gottesmanbacteria bacterium]|nr:O-antigen ligase family protein [Candidatus Gottesmanbacteria bacterium]
MDIVKWSDRIIRWGYYLLFALVPLLLTPWNYELFEFNKMMAVYALTVVITGAWIVKSITQRELRITRTPLDIPIVLFVASQLVSSLFSIDPHVSWFGYYSRFNGGMLSIMSYVLLYYAFVSNVQEMISDKQEVIRKLLKVALASGVVVALYGVAERLGIDKHLWVQDVQNRVFSSLGQPNWLAAYLVALLPLAAGFALQAQMSKLKVQNNFGLSFGFWIWSFIAVLLFLVQLFTRSRSGLLGFAVADVVFWVLVFIRPRLALRQAQGKPQGEALSNFRGSMFSFLILHFFFLFIVFFNGTSIDSVDRWFSLNAWKSRLSYSRSIEVTNPRSNEATPSAYTAPLLETGGTESGTIRKYVWQGAINAWQSSTKTKLIGTGTETFAFAFYQYRPREHNLTSEWDFLYNKAHNEYLNYLSTTGIFGLGSYLLFISSFLVWFVKNLKTQNILSFALLAGWASILVTNFFGFSVVILQVFLFMFPAMAISGEHVKVYKVKLPYAFFTPLVLLVSLALLVLLSISWYADTLYATGYRASRAGQYDVAVAELSRAGFLNPNEPLYADELGNAYAGLVSSAIDAKDATAAASLVKQSLAASDRAITTSPHNVNFWKSRTKVYYAFSSFDPAFNDAAIEALERASKLSPNDPKITYNLAILYGRKASNDKAIDLLKASIDLKPNYRDAYYALWVFYTEVKKPDLARKILEDYLAKVDPGDKDFLERLSQ